MVFRVVHSSNYSVISNHLIRDPDLQNSTLGLMVRILSLPPDWNFSVKGLTTICPNGECSIRSSLKELMEKGYLKLNKIRNSKGQFIDVEWVFYEESVKQPKSENPGLENQVVVNQ